MVTSIIKKAAGASSRFLGRHAGTLIALFSLVVASTSLLLTIGIQRRDSQRQELSLRPSLSFDWEPSLERPLRLHLRNDGLGPAVITRLTFRIEEHCVDSSEYSSFDSFNKALSEIVYPSLLKLLFNEVAQGLIDADDANLIADKLVEKGTVLLDYSTDSSVFTFHPLGLGSMIAPGKDNLIIETNPVVIKNVDDAAQRITNNLINIYRQQIDKLQMGVVYCSLSGAFCSGAIVGNIGTCWAGKNPIGTAFWPR